MPDDPRVQQLLDELLDGDGTPEDVCRSCPDLLPVVRDRWRQMSRARAELDAVFPAAGDPGSGPRGDPSGEPPLPAVPGYEVERVLGVGGMGVVFRARHVRLDRVVALKMILAGAYAGRHERDRFQREAEAVARLQHPNVVQIHDVGEADGRPYFTMEFLAGGSLAQKLSGGTPTPIREAAATVATLSGAVEAAHRAGIVHRDLKPANVLRAADGVLKVGDFGLARRVGGEAGLTRTGVAVGTPSYMAPEQARGPAAAVGPAADVYALGAILYELLTGRPPFRAETPAETVLQVIHQEPVPPARRNPRVPRDLATICLKCLQKDATKRYATAADLAADLGRFLGHEPIRARPTGRVERGLRWVRRRPAAAGLLAAVALLVLVGGVGAGLQYRQWAGARDHQVGTDQEVRAAVERNRGPLEEAWQAQDVARLTEALAEGTRAVDVARSGAASAAVRQEAETFRADAGDRLGRARRNRALLDAVLDISAPQEGGRAAARSGADEQYAAAFRRWGLDVDGSPEAEAVARLRAEPAAVLPDLAAALGGWMLERRRRQHPEAAWRRLLRVADRLDPDERHRRLRALLAGDAPPRAETVAGLAGAGLSWPALWVLARGDRWGELRDLRRGIGPRTAPVPTVVLLAQAFAAAGDAAGAEQVLQEAITARPDQAVLLDALGRLLALRGPAGRARAIECFRAARARHPRLGIALSEALLHAGRAEEAEDVVRDLLRQRPEDPVLYNYLGACLDARKQPAAAEAAYRRATGLAPDFAPAHYNLGMCLEDQGRHTAAEAACRKGLEIRPDDPDAHYYLGDVLDRQGRHAEAEAAFRRAIALRPDRVESHFKLGNTLMRQEQHGAAEAAFRAAIDLRPDHGPAHANLGLALSEQQKPGAEAAFRRAIDLQPDNAAAQNNLGMALSQQRRLGEAEAAYRKAIALDPGSALFRLNLGNVLVELARFDEGLAFVTQGVDLLTERDPLRGPAGGLLRRCRRYQALDARLPALLRGDDHPADAAVQIELGQVCQFKGLFAAAARFYRDGFTADPGLVKVVPPGLRSAAAGCAARAARGDGTDAPPGAGERAALRANALSWLRADLAACRRQVASPAAADRRAAGAVLASWLQDPDLAGLRPGWVRMGMPGPERAQWDALWSDVRETLARARPSSQPGDTPPLPRRH